MNKTKTAYNYNMLETYCCSMLEKQERKNNRMC